jgi:hypothetical protein
MNSGRYLRFDPKTVAFTEYVLPEPCGIDRETYAPRDNRRRQSIG